MVSCKWSIFMQRVSTFLWEHYTANSALGGIFCKQILLFLSLQVHKKSSFALIQVQTLDVSVIRLKILETIVRLPKNRL